MPYKDDKTRRGTKVEIKHGSTIYTFDAKKGWQPVTFSDETMLIDGVETERSVAAAKGRPALIVFKLASGHFAAAAKEDVAVFGTRTFPDVAAAKGFELQPATPMHARSEEV